MSLINFKTLPCSWKCSGKLPNSIALIVLPFHSQLDKVRSKMILQIIVFYDYFFSPDDYYQLLLSTTRWDFWNNRWMVHSFIVLSKNIILLFIAVYSPFWIHTIFLVVTMVQVQFLVSFRSSPSMLSTSTLLTSCWFGWVFNLYNKCNLCLFSVWKLFRYLAFRLQ